MLRRTAIVGLLSAAVLGLAACGGGGGGGAASDPNAARVGATGPAATALQSMWNSFRAAARAKDYRAICTRFLSSDAADDYKTYYTVHGTCIHGIAGRALFDGTAKLSALRNIRNNGGEIAAADYVRTPAPDYRDGEGIYSVQFIRERGAWRIRQLFGDFVQG